MKKKLTAVTLFLATAMTAAGCSEDVTYKEVPSGEDKAGESIVYSIYNPKTQKTEYFTADDLLGELQDGSSAQSTLYSEISRQVFTIYADNTLEESVIATIESDASDQVDEFKADARSAAREEGTDYDTYLEAQLASEGVESLEELEDLYVYQGKRDEILEDYVEDPDDDNANYKYFLQKYLLAYTPFQVKHILVAANTADTNYRDGTMTADNARKLLNVLDRFLAGDSFATIADLTDDTSSKDNGGIMPFNEAQNYVSEFRFATYAIELFQNTTVSASEAASGVTREQKIFDKARDLHVVYIEDYDELTDAEKQEELEKFVESEFYQAYVSGIQTINMSDIMKLKDEITIDDKGGYNYKYDENGVQTNPIKVTAAEQTYEMNVTKFDDNGDLNEKYYEEYEMKRNRVFNSTLNTHQVKYIELDGAYTTSNSTEVNGKTVLADENGNPIFVALASTGIHFMCDVWNSHAHTAEENENYFKLFDSSVVNYETEYKGTYIGQNGAYLNRTTLQSNSDALLDDITSYVSNLEYFLFDALVYSDTLEGDYLTSNGNITIQFYDRDNTNTIYDTIKDYVQDRITSTDETFATSVQSSVETFGTKLAREAEVKNSAANWNN